MKRIFLLLSMLSAISFQLNAQNNHMIVDGAVTGTGLHQFNYVGNGWVLGTNSTDPYRDATVSFSNQTGNYVTVNFLGNSITLFSSKASHHGIMAISIDNGTETFVDLYAVSRESYFNA